MDHDGAVTPERTRRSCSEEGLGKERGLVVGHAPVDDIREMSLEDPASLLLGVAAGARLVRGRRAVKWPDRAERSEPRSGAFDGDRWPRATPSRNEGGLT